MLAATRLRGLSRGAAFSPTDIAGIQAWWDFSDATTLFEDTGRTDPVDIDTDLIKGVTDKSGGGRHLSEATNAPQYKTAIQNSKSVARFDGTDDLLAGTLVADASWTIFIVAQKRSAPIADYDFLYCLGANAGLHANSSNHATQYCWHQTEAGGQPAVGGTATNWSIMAQKINSAASLDTYSNGGSPTNLNPNDGVTTDTAMQLGARTAGLFGDYDIGEVIIYDSVLSNTDLNRVGNYLETKWNITWTDA